MSGENAPLVLSISTLRYTNMGDHAERVRTDHVFVEGETVEEMARRVIPDLSNEWGRLDPGDVIELRMVVGADGRIVGSPPPPTISPF